MLTKQYFAEFLIFENTIIGDQSINVSVEFEAEKKFENCKNECKKGFNDTTCLGFITYQNNGKTFCQLKAGNTSCGVSNVTTSFVRRDVQSHCKGISSEHWT